MFNIFSANNEITSRELGYYSQYENLVSDKILVKTKLKYLFNNLSGCSIEKGLIRFHTIGSSYIWTIYTTSFFKKYSNLVQCFAFDWMGRQFAVSLNGDCIYMFDPATAEVYELHESIFDFLNADLVTHKHELLNCPFFYSIADLYGKNLEFDKCFGFKVLLFLGGKDELENHEVIDMELYWEINYQIFCQINKLPSGRIINKISTVN